MVSVSRLSSHDRVCHSQAIKCSVQSIMEYNGGSVVAMVGKDCVAIASDLRLGNQALTIACNHEKVCPPCACYLTSIMSWRPSRTDLPCDRPDIPWPPRPGYRRCYIVRSPSPPLLPSSLLFSSTLFSSPLSSLLLSPLLSSPLFSSLLTSHLFL